MASSTEIGDTDVVSQEMLQFVSEEISKKWRALGRYLGVRDPELDNIHADNSLSQKEQGYQMLVTWKRAKGKDSTYNILYEALRKIEEVELTEQIQERRAKLNKSNDGVSSSELMKL